MCGGSLKKDENNDDVQVHEYCGTTQTISTTKNEIISNLYNRANNLRLKSEFDKAEAHWGIVLCKYGIEYVDDPILIKKYQHAIEHR